MSGKRNISYVKPQDPSFLTKLKSQIGYKEGPTVDVKRQKLDCGRTDQDSSDGQSDHEEEKPQVVVLRSGDLTAEEVTQEEARIAREAAAVRADLSKPIIFQSKQAKDIKEARKILKKSAKKSEQLHKKFDEIAEAGVTMPEESSLLISHATNTSELMSSAVTTTANNGPQQMLNDQENGNAKVVNITSTTDAETDCMEVDAISSKGDDTQIASFPADNGISDGEDSRISANAEVKCIPVLPSSDGKNQVDESIKPASAVDDSEDSSNASDDAFPDLSPSQTVAAENQNNVVSDLKSNSGSTKHIDSMSKAGCERSDLPPNGNSKKSVSYEGTNSDGTDDVRMDKANEPALCSKKDNGSEKKENGSAESTLKVRHDTGIVDLDDESDEEMPSPKQQTQERDPLSATCADSVQATLTAIDATGKKAQSVCSDSDGAVVIASDSDNELSIISPKKTGSQQKPVTEVIDDDDDDCVVIEDDSPAPPATDLIKRKSVTMNSPNNLDDPQPPSKRQRSTPQTGVNQITIKDARSLLPQEAAAAAAAKKMVDGSVYPVNITPAPSVVPGPPKLVPVATPTMQMGSFPGLGSNTNLLPGLTDDMFVLEAPSFIVPYIYEKPPTDQLKDIVKGIETKYRLTKEDLAEADKSDEFDMITEQNKEDKGDKGGKKKKRRRGGDDADESWSEESEEDEDDDDDDDSESGMRTKVLIKEASDDLTALKGAIKPAAALAQSPSTAAAAAAKPGQENYFESPLGKFFMDIGVGLVQEFVQSDLIRLQKRKMRKSLGKNITEFERAISALSGNLEASKKKNTAFKFTMKRCEFCNFKSESALAMANHYETPHMNGPLYKCNFCTFEIRNATEIVYHMEAMHNIKARLIKPLPYHQCPNCGFEDNGKAKLARHQPVCAKKFRPELNLAPPNDWEAPAKIPRIKPRHGLVGTATAYQAMAAQAAAQKAALASIQQQQQQAAQARSLQAAALAAQNAANKIRGRPPTITKPGLNSNVMLRGPNQVRNPMATNVVLPNNYQVAGGQLIQAANTIAKKALSGQPSISITPLPRQNATPQITSPSTSKMPPTGMKPGQNPSGNKAQFVICEICDGYIKDLEQLRNHMQWMHKVKIHPKMIYNRPPLNCQKCQFRFFTDQGLERHLLGSHGLVTSSMQEAANKGKDAGRCPVCGRMYQWKLLNHVSRDHHMTLKPAHLSYKCTVCTATFGMYKQFETHVYTAHSTVAKKAMDGKKNNTPPGVGIASSTSSSLQRGNLVPSNDSLLKPLKINDEITIIPQPAMKPRLTNIESHVID